MIDILMAMVTIAFAYSLVPQILKSVKSRDLGCFSWQTLIISTVGVWVMTGCFFEMGKVFVTISNFFVAICWSVLLILKITLTNRKS